MQLLGRVLYYKEDHDMEPNTNHGIFMQALVRGLATPSMTKGEKQGMLLTALVVVFVALL